ncbi:MAG: molybdenum ABC transporter ATP-binding protein [Notoacmeibacter sp.]
MNLSIETSCRLGDFQLNVKQAFSGEGVTALFGPSGCGKSTLLRIIAGLETRASGKVVFGDAVWQNETRFLPAPMRGIGFVFQEPRLFPHLSVAGNLAFAEKRSMRVKSEITYEKVVAALDLEPLLGRRVTALSGGEKQRVAIGRALLTNPSLMLMDEPLSALDINRRSAILPLIRSLPETFGLPVIYVTHAIDEVAQIADRIALMDRGTIGAEGPLETIFENPALDHLTGRFEAGVILDAEISGHDLPYQLTSLVCQGHNLTMPIVPLKTGDTVRLRIRARDVSLATEIPRGLTVRNILPVKIISIALDAETAFAEVVLAFGSAKLRSRVTRASVADLGLQPGDNVYALLKSIAFDRRSLGTRL